ncbi:Hypothetical predicted protein [Mytilus galloprovincialis]|uniref:Apple domain-containing protein n=1 Tax=Mytilus galloprovincialis TaxID=29158 RepID=A0A8B6DPW9_MYTGA|nr:Hypothetical predicted protein [Mytilus galloprovincialis]
MPNRESDLTATIEKVNNIEQILKEKLATIITMLSHSNEERAQSDASLLEMGKKVKQTSVKLDQIQKDIKVLNSLQEPSLYELVEKSCMMIPIIKNATQDLPKDRKKMDGVVQQVQKLGNQIKTSSEEHQSKLEDINDTMHALSENTTKPIYACKVQNKFELLENEKLCTNIDVEKVSDKICNSDENLCTNFNEKNEHNDTFTPVVNSPKGNTQKQKFCMVDAEPVDPCPSHLNNTVVDICTDDSAIEDSVDESKAVDSVLLRITKHQNNCICHVTLHNNATDYTMYMSKYEGQSNAAPEQHNCGLAVDVEYVDNSDTIRSLQPIECTNGTSMRSIELESSELKLKSRIIDGDFTRGYCMQISRNQVIYTCKMNAQEGKSGDDADWIQARRTEYFDACERYCIQTEACGAVHYQSNTCFVYNKTILTSRDGATYSQKQCYDNQIKIKCHPPESTTETSQGTTIDDTFSTKFVTLTKPIGNNHVAISSTQSAIERENTITKENDSASVSVIIVAVVGWCATALFAITTFYVYRLYRRSNRPRTASVRELNANNYYEDLSALRLSTNYNSHNISTVKAEQHEHMQLQCNY